MSEKIGAGEVVCVCERCGQHVGEATAERQGGFCRCGGQLWMGVGLGRLDVSEVMWSLDAAGVVPYDAEMRA